VSFELAFVLAPRQNLFFQELVEALRHEVAAQGVPASVHVGNFPPPRPDLVYVMVPPHEYFTILNGRHGPLPEVLKQRTMFICGEQPDTPFFDSNVELAPRGGRVFDINRYAVREFNRLGIEAQHLQLGWTPAWDHLNDGERDIDILFMGATSDKRNRALASYARTFLQRRVEIVLSDNSAPNWAPSGSFLDDEHKWDLLRRAKVILNIHQDRTLYFEWLRIIQAISCGAVVVSEYSVDFEPLVAGEHLLMGDLGSLHLLCERLLDDPGRLWEIRSAAYDKVHEDMRLADAATQLITAAGELAETDPIQETRHRFFTQPQPDPDELPFFKNLQQPARPVSDDQDAAWTRRALKDLRLEMLDMRRSLVRIERAAAGLPRSPDLELVAKTQAYESAVPRVSVLTALYNHAAEVGAALNSAAASQDIELELIVVDDGSTDGSSSTVLDWMTEHQDIPALLLRHPINLGLAAARNHALSIARGELCFALDADNEVFPSCLLQLERAIDSDRGAAFAYSYLEMFNGDQPVGLMNQFPWEPTRLRFGNYIDAMALMRTAIIRDQLGGYPTDRRLYGWEDYALWCAVATAGHHAIRVPEILARYRVAAHSMLSLTNISSTDAFSVLTSANPVLMAGLEEPPR
jgi:hypothetical protein